MSHALSSGDNLDGPCREQSPFLLKTLALFLPLQLLFSHPQSFGILSSLGQQNIKFIAEVATLALKV